MALNSFLDLAPHTSDHHTFLSHKHKQTPSDIDWKALPPNFGYQSEDVIKATYQVTSQCAATFYPKISSRNT